MGTRDPRVDAYIARSAPFAQPILTHLRATVHAAVPDVKEDIKWGMPHFMHYGILGCMAAFKAHCAFVIRSGSRVLGPAKQSGAMGDFGRITALEDLPSDAKLTAYLRKAAALNRARKTEGPRRAAPRKPAPKTPVDLDAALARNAKARTTFEAFSPSHRREYVEWITGAKREETRKKRVATAVAWMAEEKSQNWRYEKRG